MMSQDLETKCLPNLALLRKALANAVSDWQAHAINPLSQRTARLDLSCSGQPFAAILQSHGPRDRQLNPNIARDEFRLLRLLYDAGLLVPRPLLLLDDLTPPAFLTACVEGETLVSAADFPALPERLARILFQIHTCGLATHQLSFLPNLRDRLSENIGNNGSGDCVLRQCLRQALPHIGFNQPTLLHGDFWLGNLLWRGGELAAIVDWEDAMFGDPLADLGKSRLELLWSLGEAAMERYTECYLRLNPNLDVSALPFWELYGASRLAHFDSFAPDAAAAERMHAQYEAFVEAALARL